MSCQWNCYWSLPRQNLRSKKQIAFYFNFLCATRIKPNFLPTRFYRLFYSTFITHFFHDRKQLFALYYNWSCLCSNEALYIQLNIVLFLRKTPKWRLFQCFDILPVSSVSRSLQFKMWSKTFQKATLLLVVKCNKFKLIKNCLLPTLRLLYLPKRSHSHRLQLKIGKNHRLF